MKTLTPVAVTAIMMLLLTSVGWAKPSPIVSQARLKTYRSTYVALAKQASPWIRRQLKGLPASMRNAPRRMLKSTDKMTRRLLDSSPKGLRSNDSRERSRLGCSMNVASSADGKRSLSVSVSSGPLGGAPLPEHSFGMSVQLQHHAADGSSRTSDYTSLSLSTKLKPGQVISMLPQQVGTVGLSRSRTHKSGLIRALDKVALRQADGGWLVRTDYFRSQPNVQSPKRTTSFSRFTPGGERVRLTPAQGQQLWDAQ